MTPESSYDLVEVPCSHYGRASWEFMGCWGLLVLRVSMNCLAWLFAQTYLQHGSDYCLLALPGSSWLFLAPPGCSCLLLASSVTLWLSWLLMALLGSSWLLQALLGFLLAPFASPGFSWLLLALPGFGWCFLETRAHDFEQALSSPE